MWWHDATTRVAQVYWHSMSTLQQAHHRRSQDFRWECTLLLPPKLITFLVIIHRLPFSEIITYIFPTEFIQSSWKFDFSLSRGGGHLTTYHSKLGPQNFSVLALGVNLHPVHPWLRLWRCVILSFNAVMITTFERSLNDEI